MLDRFNTEKFFVKSIVAVFMAHALDVLTTLIAQWQFGGCEGNPFLSDPFSCKLLTGRAIVTKILGTAFYVAPAAAILWYMTKNWFVASIPSLFLLAHLLTGPVSNNFALILQHLILGA